MGMAVGGGKGGVRADINMTPLIDIVLVLLIIFMVLTPMMLKELNANTPKSEEIKLPDQPPSTDIYMVETKADGKLLLNGTPLGDNELFDKLKEGLAPKPDSKRIVFFKTDDDAGYGRVVRAMDLARGAGAKTLGVASATKKD